MTPCQDYDPCKCAPGQDKEIVFNKATCLATDPNLLWDYDQGLLTIDGRMAASGYVSSSSQVEGAYIAPMALGQGALNFTPPNGYGGLVYRGGSIFYYWDNTLNGWEEIDFSGDIVASQVNLAHNGTLIGAFSTLNFVDSNAGAWTITPAGDIDISVSSTWLANQNANGFNLTNVGNLSTANEIVSNNLSVDGNLYYKGQLLDNLLGTDLWTLNPDQSIYRNSNVYIYGSQISPTTSYGPLTVTSNTPLNYLYLNVASGANQWAALGIQFNGTYSGELGFGPVATELWIQNQMIFRGYSSDGHAYFPGQVGMGIANPQYALEISGDVRLTPHAAIPSPNGSGLEMWVLTDSAGHIDNYNYDLGVFLPLYIDGNPLALNSNAVSGSVGIKTLTPVYPLDVNGIINTNACYYSNGMPIICPNASGGVDLQNVDSINGSSYPPTVGPGAQQTPWLSNINAANYTLANVSAIGVGGGTTPGNAINITQTALGVWGIGISQSNSAAGAGMYLTSNSSVAQVGLMGTAASVGANMYVINTNAAAIGFFMTNTEKMRVNVNGVGISNGNPQYPLDVGGIINTSSCYYIAGSVFACAAGGGSINLSNIATINGQPPASSSTPFAQVAYGSQNTSTAINNVWFGIPGATVTVPVAGTYLVTGSLFFILTYLFGMAFMGTILINGNPFGSSGQWAYTQTSAINEPFTGYMSQSWLVNLSAGDVIQLAGQMTAGTTDGVDMLQNSSIAVTLVV